MSCKTNMLPVCIIGSGLSGVSAAMGLRGSEQKILMLDAGLDYSKKTEAIVSTLSRIPAYQWTDEERKKLRGGVESSATGVKEKLQYGSNYSSRSLDIFPIKRKGSKFYTSFAKGGLSNIWGAGLLPMHNDDMADWPITLDELQPHYEEVLKFMPLAGQHDSLERLLPLYCKPSSHGFSRQAMSVLSRMEKNRDQLKENGICFGASRLAARYHDSKGPYDCQYCGMCMYGCPYGVLYSSKMTLNELQNGQNFKYQSGFVVTHLKEYDDKVKIYGTDISGNKIEAIEASTVIMAAGAPATTKIILSSLGRYDKPIRMLTSDQYYMPLLSFGGQSNVEREALHTMCQSFWVMQNKEVSPYLIHFSLYTYNDLYREAIKNMLGSAYSMLRGLVQFPLQRLYFMFCYLHSSESGLLTATLKKGGSDELVIEGHKNPDSKQIYTKARKVLQKSSRLTGLYPAPFYRGEKLPGGGNHIGGSFPMRKSPIHLQTDPNGRLYGFNNIYIADSSIFPSITATTITLSVVANAHRIGKFVHRNFVKE